MVRLFRKYGMENEDYEALESIQFRRCAICLQEPTEGKKLVVDHDHNTGYVRGLLCSGCNSGLGFFKDSPSSLKRAIKYLSKQPYPLRSKDFE